jgi:hypothetical protein
MAMVGCGKKTTPVEPEANTKPKVMANKPEPPKTEPQKQVPPKVEPKKPELPKTELKPVAKIPTNAIVNTLGMPFVPVPGTKVQFCIWETRVKDYATYAAANEGVDAAWKYPIGGKQGETHPVVMVRWEHAKAFCAWLTKKELAEGKIKAGQKYRLPTDAEWSMAVGLGKEKGNTPKEKYMGGKDVYPWGKEWPPPKGAGNYSDGLKVDNFDNASPMTSPVGSFAPNKLGLHDLGGNVWEWCEDKWSPTSDDRVLRGASWYDGAPILLRSSNRYDVVPIHFNGNAGFRCALAGE